MVAALFLAVAFGLFTGCSDGDVAPTAVTIIVPDDGILNDIELGKFRIILDEDAWELRVEPMYDRGAEWNVTQYAEVDIVKTQWDGAKRNWTLTVSLKNNSPLTGYGVWGVFTELGAKEIVVTDGFIYTQPPDVKRVPVVAFAKDQVGRIFVSKHQDVRDIIIHWPEGVDKWFPIEFYVDAAWPNPRKMPVVENLDVKPEPGFSFIKSVLAYVKDWQEASKDLTVWADMSAVGGGMPLMFDDGQHLDGAAGDDVFGGFFLDEAPSPGVYTFTVYAEDPLGHKFENDCKSEFTGGSIPDKCFDYTVLREGSHGKIHAFQELCIEDKVAFQDYWMANFGDITELPDIDFDAYRVAAINMGGCSSSGHIIRMDRICIDPWVDCLCINVDYIREHPGVSCITLPVGTSPYWIGSFPKTIHMVHFFGMDYTYNCPNGDASLNHWLITEGGECNIISPKEFYIDNQTDWESFWANLTGTSDMPPDVDFGQYSVVAVTMGIQERGMYFPDLRRVLLVSGSSPKYVAHYNYVYPDAGCYSTYIPTVPYGIWKIEKPDYPLEFDRSDVEMTCK